MIEALNSTSLDVLSGGAVGYITNYLAIRMLFKKYLGVGGVILEKKEELVENLSKLVEEKLVTPETLLSELEKESFINSFANFISDGVFNALHVMGQKTVTFKNIDGYSKLLENIKDFMKEHETEVIQVFIDTIFRQINIKELLTEEQIKNILKNVYPFLLDSFQSSFPSFSDEFFKSIKDKQISYFISPKIAENISEKILPADFTEHLKEEFEEDIDETLKKVINQINLKNIIDHLEGNLREKKISDLFKDSKDNNLVLNEKMYPIINDFVKSKNGKKLIKDLVTAFLEIIKELKESDLKLDKFLNKSIEDKIKTFIENKLPILVKELENWVEKKKSEINQIIDDSVAQVSESYWWVVKLIKVLFIGKVSETLKPIEKALVKIKQLLDQNKQEDIYLKVIEIINSYTLGDIINFLEDKNVFQNIEVFIQRIVTDGISKISSSELLFEQLDRKIDDLFKKSNFNFSTALEENIVSFLETTVKEFIFDKKKDEFIKKEIKRQVNKFNDQKISDYFENMNKFNILFFDILSQNKNKNNIIRFSSVNIFLTIENHTLFSFSNSYSGVNEYLKSKISNFYIDYLPKYLHFFDDNNIEKYILKKKFAIHDFLVEQNTQQEISMFLAKEFQNRLNTSKWLDNKIYNIAKNELTILSSGDESNNELVKTIDSFMGQEMKPLTGVGAGLGIVSGLALLPLSIYFPVLYSFPYNFAVVPVLFGTTGWLTNVLAIKMLFWPYEEKYFPGTKIKVPLTPGIVGQQDNKKRFGKSLGQQVSTKLLRKEILKEIITEHEEKIANNITDFISQKNFYLIEKKLNKHRNQIYNDIIGKSLPVSLQMLDNKLISENIVKQINEIDLKQLSYSKIITELFELINKHKSNLNEFIFEFYKEQFILSGKDLKDFIPNDIKEDIDNKLILEITKFIDEKLISTIGDEKFLNNKLKDLANNYDYLLDKPLQELVSIETQNKFINNLKTFLYEKLSGSEINNDFANYIHDNYLNKELDPGNMVKDIFGGNLVEKIDLPKRLKEILNYLETLGFENKQNLNDYIYCEILKGKNENFLGNLIPDSWVEPDIKNTISKVVDNIFNYLGKQKSSLHDVITNFVNKNIANQKLSELGISPKIFNTDNLLKIINEKILTKKNIVNSINFLSEDIIQKVILNDITLRDILKILKINNISDLLFKFNTEIDELREILLDTLGNNEEIIKKKIIDLFLKIIEKELYSRNISDFFENLSKDDVLSVIGKIVDSIIYSDSFYRLFRNTLEDTIKKAKNQKIYNLLDIKLLEEDLNKVFSNLLKDPNISKKLINDLENIGLQFIREFNSIVPFETKKYLLEIILIALLEVLKEHIDLLLKDINIKEIVEKRIEEMNPKEIEDVFDFAKGLFRRLEVYGFSGGIIGFASELIKRFI